MALNIGTTIIRAAENESPLRPNIDELVVGSLAFAIVFFLLAKALLPRISKTLEERTNAIEGGIERAKQAEAEAQQTLEQYRAQLAEARHEASRLREDAREQGATIIAEMREQAQAEARRITDAAHQQIEADRQRAVNQLRVQVGTLATDLASRIVGESLEDDARQRRVIDRFLDDLEQSAGDGAAATSSSRPTPSRDEATRGDDAGGGDDTAEGSGTGPLGKVRAAASAVAGAVATARESRPEGGEGDGSPSGAHAAPVERDE